MQTLCLEFILPSNYTPLITMEHNQITNVTTIQSRNLGDNEGLLPVHEEFLE
jgi:hypothetical protein